MCFLPENFAFMSKKQTYDLAETIDGEFITKLKKISLDLKSILKHIKLSLNISRRFSIKNLKQLRKKII